MAISPFAQKLLDSHAQRRDFLFYDAGILGSMFRDADLTRLDAAYRELESEKLIESSGELTTFFGEPKVLYRVTQEGLRQARQESAA